MSRYSEFIGRLAATDNACGFEVSETNPNMFDWQADIVRYACKYGRFGGYEACGLGKTLQQLECAHQIRQHADGKVLILAPLAVAQQTKREAYKFDIGTDVTVCKSADDVRPGINVANYERLHLFDASDFVAVILDEGSILKSVDGKTKSHLLGNYAGVPYRQSWTATPSPNDVMEFGNQAAFLGVMSREEMLATYFVHDSGETQKWRLKGHAREAFWEWMASWSVVIQSPADLGYDAGGYDLPPLVYHEHIIESAPQSGLLFPVDASTLAERRAAKKATIAERIQRAADLANESDERWVIWCNLNDEGTALAKAIPDAVEVAGRHSMDEKEDRLSHFVEGDIRVLITKPKIGGFGLNMQHCHNTVIFPTDSFEAWYQQIRRFWRFGQTEAVNVHLIASEREGAIVANLKRKEAAAQAMFDALVGHMRAKSTANIHSTTRDVLDYTPTQEMEVPEWMMQHCV